MKKTLSLLLLTTAAIASASQPAVGTVSAQQSFAINSSGNLTEASLSDYEGSILVMMVMTPWCSICVSNSNALGDGILDHFNNPSRGELQGKTDQGIPVRSVILSSLPNQDWSTQMEGFRTNHGYDEWGFDADTSLNNPLEVLSYYLGAPFTVNDINRDSQNRRRIVVLNLVEGSDSHEFREILLNTNSFGSASALRATMNSVMPAPSELTFSDWQTDQALPVNSNDINDDPDGDGITNVWEFYFGTDPMKASSNHSGPAISIEGNMRYLNYQQASGIGGFNLEHTHSTNLANWTPLDTSNLEMTEADGIETRRLPLPSGDQGFFRLELTLP